MADSEERQKFEATELLELAWASYEERLDGPEAAWKAFKFAFEAGMRAGEIARWIPVEEEMPKITRTWTDCGNTYKESDEILIFDSKVGRRTGWLHSSAWSSSDDEILRNVTHWQPLPAAPEEKK